MLISVNRFSYLFFFFNLFVFKGSPLTADISVNSTTKKQHIENKKFENVKPYTLSETKFEVISNLYAKIVIFVCYKIKYKLKNNVLL